MKVLYDARWILIENRFDGVSRYTHELAHAMAARDDLEMVWLIHDMRQLDKLPKGDYLLVNKPEDFLAETFTLARHINRAGYKLVYSPFFVMGTLGKRYRLVLTIHDMIYFTHRTPPQWFPWHVRLGWRLFHLTYWPMRRQLNRADMVATVSETARQELLDARATKRPIVTVANAVNENFAEGYEQIAGVSDPHLYSRHLQPASSPANGREASVRLKQSAARVAADAYSTAARSEAASTVEMPSKSHHLSNSLVYMGAFTPYKNVECLIDTLALLPNMTLHLCGKMPLVRRPVLEQRMRDRGVVDRVVIYDGATDEQYKQALSDARCSISASRLEGFGLPVLEAQQRGVPFVAADTPIFHEIGRDSVLYFDPDSPEAAAECIRSLADEATSQDYIARGFDNITRYTWARSAASAAELCRQVSGI
jgi:glycosyltransferase involved in cell wall biosynthesis